MFPESEGFLLAIQDQVVATNSNRKHILNQNINDKCRLCKVAIESIQHITTGCTILAGREYLERHNNLAKVIHQSLAKYYHFAQVSKPYYRYTPQSILSDKETTIYWDQPVITDHNVPNNKLDILVVQKREGSAIIVEIGVPGDENVHKVVAEKMRKYQQLCEELKQLYHLKEGKVLPLIISSNGLVPDETVGNCKELGLPDSMLEEGQKAVLLGTVRKVFNIS